jgi:U3 small nucleolar RNA-associated protein MPP10
MDNFENNKEEEEVNALDNILIDIDSLSKNIGKLNSKQNLNKFSEVFSTTLNELNPNNDQTKIDIHNLDEYQMFEYLNTISQTILNQYKSYTSDIFTDSIIKELKTEKSNLIKSGKSVGMNKKRGREDEEKENEEEEDDGEDYNDDEEEGDIEEGKDANEDVEEEEEEEEQDFFNMREFNAIGDEEFDEKEKNEEEEEFEEEDDEKEFKYEDFFDKPEKKGDYENEEEGEDDIEDQIFAAESKLLQKVKIDSSKQPKNKDNYINKEMDDMIEESEQKLIKEKEWHMKGEVSSRSRPKGSLLENFLDFDVSVKPPPIQTQDYTEMIEKIIKMRIKDDLFDDPVRKSSININNKKGPETELNFAKSKKGLAEIYEEEYETQNKLNPNTKEYTQAQREIDEMCNKIYSIFDKMTNNNFISGNRNIEMKVVTNIPAIQMEEIGNYVTDNKSGAKSAHEIYSSKDAQTKTREEMNKEEKQTSHKRWKRNVRTHLHEKERKKKMNQLTKQLDSKFEAKLHLKQQADKNKQISSKGGLSKNAELKSSKFFSSLQKVAEDDMNKKANKKMKREEGEEIGNKTVKQYKI